MQMATASIYNAEKTNKQKVYRLFIAHKRRQELWIQQANSTTCLFRRRVYRYVIIVKILIYVIFQQKHRREINYFCACYVL